jgi:hypothetical protein
LHKILLLGSIIFLHLWSSFPRLSFSIHPLNSVYLILKSPFITIILHSPTTKSLCRIKLYSWNEFLPLLGITDALFSPEGTPLVDCSNERCFTLMCLILVGQNIGKQPSIFLTTALKCVSLTPLKKSSPFNLI